MGVDPSGHVELRPPDDQSVFPPVDHVHILVRIILPAVPVRLAAGRETALKDFVGMAFMAGADGMMIGGYLTQQGRLPAEDQQLIEEIKRLWSA